MTQLHQVLLNLAVNARDAMPRGGRLTLGVRNLGIGEEPQAQLASAVAASGWVELSVTDTGTGMTEEVMKHLFDPFFTTKPRGKGTGLGLATVYGIVRSHGGAVEVTTQVGSGSTFRVLLPRSIETKPTEPIATNGIDLQGAGRRVLVGR